MTIFSSAGFPPCALWDYATKLYSHAPVEKACLSLQERRGADVNLLLFCVWVAASGRETLTQDELETGYEISVYWQGNTVKPMRSIRRFFKTQPKHVDARLTNELKRVMGQSEIYAEKLQLLALDQLIKRPATASFSDSVGAQAAIDNLFKYLCMVQIVTPDAQDRTDLFELWRVAFPDEDTALFEACG